MFGASVDPVFIPVLQKSIENIDMQNAKETAAKVLASSELKEIEQILGLTQ